MTTAYPLAWPPGKPRTQRPEPSRFGTNAWGSNQISLARAVRELLSEIKALGGINEVISSNLKLRLDGLPYSNQRTPDDAGIAVYFDIRTPAGDRRPVCIACDRWAKQACNVWAIAKSINALRGLERWGGGDMVQAAFTGFLALPSPSNNPWWVVLDYPSEAAALASDFEARAKSLAQRFHPDKPEGDTWRFQQIMAAREAGRLIHGTLNTATKR